MAALSRSLDLKSTMIPGTRGEFNQSDHASFYRKDVPVLFFFTGTHPDYHRPSDDYPAINYEGMARIADLGEIILLDLARRPERPAFISPSEAPAPEPSVGAIQGGGAYFGSRPNYAFDGQGVKLDGVSEGSPAEKAGLQGGRRGGEIRRTRSHRRSNLHGRPRFQGSRGRGRGGRPPGRRACDAQGEAHEAAEHFRPRVNGPALHPGPFPMRPGPRPRAFPDSIGRRDALRLLAAGALAAAGCGGPGPPPLVIATDWPEAERRGLASRLDAVPGSIRPRFLSPAPGAELADLIARGLRADVILGGPPSRFRRLADRRGLMEGRWRTALRSPMGLAVSPSMPGGLNIDLLELPERARPALADPRLDPRYVLGAPSRDARRRLVPPPMPGRSD